MRASLTFEEKITAAYLHYVREVEQQTIAMAMGVNMGRVNEACMAVKHALQPAGVMRFQEKADKAS